MNISNGKNAPAHVAGHAFFGNVKRSLAGSAYKAPSLLRKPGVLIVPLGGEDSLSRERFEDVVRGALATSYADESALKEFQEQLKDSALMGHLQSVLRRELKPVVDGQEELRADLRALKRPRLEGSLASAAESSVDNIKLGEEDAAAADNARRPPA